jgi:serine-type D-Ala-D-Ala carboxypeptidase/endopeptidase
MDRAAVLACPIMVVVVGHVCGTEQWLDWHLDRFSTSSAEMRLLDHAAYARRNGLRPVFGLDEFGRVDAMGLKWVVMMLTSEHPLILQKAGGFRAFSVTWHLRRPAESVDSSRSINSISGRGSNG